MILKIGGLIARLTGKSESEVIAALKLNADGEDLKPQAEVEQYLSDVFGSKFRDIAEGQFKRGLREKGEQFEKEIKEKYGLTSTAQGVNLVSELLESNATKIREESGKGATKLTAETAKDNPIVRELLTQAVTDAIAEKETIISGLENDLNSERTKQNVASVKDTIRQIQANQKWRFDETLRSKQEDIFFKAIDFSKFKKDENGKYIPVDEKGNHLLGDNYQKVSIEDYISSMNPYGVHEFDPNVSTPGSTSQTPNGTPSGEGANFNGINLKDPEAVAKYVSDPSVKPEQRAEVMKKFEETQKS